MTKPEKEFWLDNTSSDWKDHRNYEGNIGAHFRSWGPKCYHANISRKLKYEHRSIQAFDPLWNSARKLFPDDK